MDLNANPNTWWMSIFVEELARNGLEEVCIAPGSRSTPLTLAFAGNPDVRIYRHLDERSAGFFALGLAKGCGRPVALVCTSGTAAANFHPAIVEAYYSHVPLLVLTADRPPELRGSGANQTIDQVKMYGDHVRWSVEVPTPQANATDVVLRYLRTLAARAYATAGGFTKGPVHLNFPFRKPLEPEGSPDRRKHHYPTKGREEFPAYTTVNHGRLLPHVGQISTIADTVASHPRGIIVCGPECPDGSFPADVAALAQRCGYPILADSLSNVRHGPQVAGGLILGGYHLWLPAVRESIQKSELVLRFGDVSTSSALIGFLNDAAPENHFHIREDGEWADDLHLTHHYTQVEPSAFCRVLMTELLQRNHQPQVDWADEFTAVEARNWAQIDHYLSSSPFFDAAAVSRLLSTLPNDTVLFAGNSLPVRHIDTLDRPSEKRLIIYGNRGASGIDGNVSTALGLAAATGKRVVALLGDITFYHDMNGLLAVRQHSLDNITFIVINNNGGGIFRQLPIAQYDPPFTDLFLTPHGLTFEHAAAMYGLDYMAVRNEVAFSQALQEVFTDHARPGLIEIITDGANDYEQMRDLSDTAVKVIRPERAPAT